MFIVENLENTEKYKKENKNIPNSILQNNHTYVS